MEVQIIAQLEISDHDGYCSGAECDYKIEFKTHNVQMSRRKFKQAVEMEDFVEFLPQPNINTNGSYYCDLTKKCQQHNMHKHSHRYTVLDVMCKSNDANSNSDTDNDED